MSAFTGGSVVEIQPVVFRSRIVSIGDYETLARGPQSVCVGSRSITEFGASDSVAVGSFCWVSTHSSVAVGNNNYTGVGGGFNYLIGSSNNAGIGAGRIVQVGAGHYAFGAFGPSAIDAVMVGFQHQNAYDFTNTVEIGAVNATSGGAGGDTNIMIGNRLGVLGTVGASISRSTLIGREITTEASADVISMGYLNTVTGTSNYSVVQVGVALLTDGVQNIQVGWGSASDTGINNLVSLGNNNQVTSAGSGGDTAILIGNNLTLQGSGNVSRNILIGGGSISGTGSGATNTTSIGHSNTIGQCVEDLVVGNSNNLASGTSLSLLVGHSSSVAGSLSYVTLMAGWGSSSEDSWTTVVGSASAAYVGTLGSQIFGIQCTTYSPYCFVGGSNSHVWERSGASVCIGDQNNVFPDSLGCVSLGPSYGGFTIGELCPGGIVIGTGHIGTITAFNPLLVGSPDCISVGSGSVVADNSNRAIALGADASASGNRAIAVGSRAAASAYEFIVADNVSSADAVHTFAVRGYNGAALDTIKAVDNPGADETGLTVVYNNGATTANKLVKAAVSPPVGSVLLYVDP